MTEEEFRNKYARAVDRIPYYKRKSGMSGPWVVKLLCNESPLHPLSEWVRDKLGGKAFAAWGDVQHFLDCAIAYEACHGNAALLDEYLPGLRVTCGQCGSQCLLPLLNHANLACTACYGFLAWRFGDYLSLTTEDLPIRRLLTGWPSLRLDDSPPPPPILAELHRIPDFALQRKEAIREGIQRTVDGLRDVIPLIAVYDYELWGAKPPSSPL